MVPDLQEPGGRRRGGRCVSARVHAGAAIMRSKLHAAVLGAQRWAGMERQPLVLPAGAQACGLRPMHAAPSAASPAHCCAAVLQEPHIGGAA